MSAYASELAHARLDALRNLIDALNEAETPDEKRRCAVAIFNAPDPCELDNEFELEDEDEDEASDDQHKNPHTPGMSEFGSPSESHGRTSTTPSQHSSSTPSPSSPPAAQASLASPTSRHLKNAPLSPITHEVCEHSLASIDDLDDPDELAEDPFPNIPTEQLIAQATAALQRLQALDHPS